MKFDVAIIGMGPTGCVAAARLGQAGFKVLIIDKATEVYPKPRAIAMDHEIMRVFQELGIANEVAKYTEPFTASEHFGADGQMIRRLDMLPPPYPMGWTPSMVFLQPPVEKILRERVASFPNVSVKLGCELTDLHQDIEGVEFVYNDAAGQVITARSKYVIGCDGASSMVRRLVNLELEDLDFDEPWLVIDVEANASGMAKLPRSSAQYCEPARPISYVIGTGCHRRWEIMLLPGEDPETMLADDQIWQLLARWLNPEDGTLWRKAAYRFHALVAKDWRKDRIFLAGDAAHQQPPFLGQGMCQGIRDAVNLTWKLEHVLRKTANDAASEALLDSYGLERGAHVRALTTTIKGIGRYICERDITLARARDAKLLADQGGVVTSVPRQDLIPPLTTGLVSKESHTAHGSLFPQPRVRHDGAVMLMDDAYGHGWRLVTLDSALVQALSGMAYRPFDDLAVIQLIELDGICAAWFAKHKCIAAIVRPDHYVYAVMNSLDDVLTELITLKRRL
jgi:3-(3-hydroxy-phenyl)propionate hydroxylase